MDEEDLLVVEPPLYLITGRGRCWKCGQPMQFAGLLAAGPGDSASFAFTISGLTSLPEQLLAFVQDRVPTFRLQHSHTAGYSYLANTCGHCGAMTGDHYLFSEPEAPFFPTTDEQASSLQLEAVPVDGALELDGNPGFGVASHILEHARRLP